MEHGVAPRRGCAALLLVAFGLSISLATGSPPQAVNSDLPSPVGVSAQVTALIRVAGVGPTAAVGGAVSQAQALQPPVQPPPVEPRPVQPPPVEPQPVQPPPVEPQPVQPPPTGGAASPLGTVGAPSADILQALEAGRRILASEPSANVVSGNQAPVLASTDVGDLLAKSLSVTGVETQKRSPIANETRVRGYNLGQTLTSADGAFWFPARQDLDTFLSKIDSGIVRNVIVLKGPYSARYGPGFSFIDIETEQSPRYQHGFEAHGRSLVSYKINGEQLYGREGVWGGSSDWGFRASYGHRTGNDYRTGGDVAIPASYNARDADFVYGINLGSSDNRLEFGYMRLDQTGLEFPGQIFDTDFLVTNGYRVRFTSENQYYFDYLTIDGWYNRTSLAGNAQGFGKRRQIPQLDLLGFTGFTDIDLASTGYRVAVTWGQTNERQLTVGTDFRYLDGELNEFDRLLSFAVPCASALNFPIPRSHRATVGGLFIESVMPVDEQLVIKSGLRGDFVGLDIDNILSPGFCPGDFEARAGTLYGQTTDFQRQYGLFLGYLTGEYKLNCRWTAQGGVGHSQRPPTTTELYALQPFLAVLQQGFTTVVGNPRLDPERLYQLDIGLRADYEWFRAGANGFYAFIEDYITFEDIGAQQGIVKLPPEVTNAKTVKFVNTPFATLAGFEVYGEVDATDWLTPFLTMSFVEGRDQDRGTRAAAFGNTNVALNIPEEPLPGIPPLETRVGLRFHEARRVPRWGLEMYARIVDSQNRVATSLGEVRSAGFTVYDLRSFWQVTPGILLTGGVENLFDKNYREHLDLRTGLGVFQPGVNGYFGMELRF